MRLPIPRLKGTSSLETVLFKRRSVRTFSGQPLTAAELGQLLWAGQGWTMDDGRRTAPSAGGLYPIELYAVVGDASGIDAGLYRYDAELHELITLAHGDVRKQISELSAHQYWIADAPVILVVTGVYARTEVRYGPRSERYVWMEAGHVAQNICLQATAATLAVVGVGAFDEVLLGRILDLPRGEEPLYLIPVGH